MVNVVHSPSYQEMHRKHRKHPNSYNHNRQIQGSLEVERYLQGLTQIKLKNTRTSKNLMMFKWLLKLMISNSG